MKALRISASGVGLEDVSVPSERDEALVHVLKSGICNTDLELIKGYAGFKGTIGHEFVGVVESSANSELIGRRVVGEINVGCTVCELCRSGDERHCPNRTVLGIHGRDGAHAEYLTLPERNLILVPEGISDNEAVFVEPLAAAIGILERLRSDIANVAVVGDGKLGILCARALAGEGRNVTLVGKHPRKLDIARSPRIKTILLSESGQLRKFETVVEASGSLSGFETALQLIRPRGAIVLKSTFHSPLTVDSSRIVVDEISVIGSRCGRFGPAIDVLNARKISVEDLITDEFSLDEAVRALDRSTQTGVLKVLLRP